MSKRMQAIDPSERVKIAQLQSEIKQDSDKKMEWLYSGDKIDRNAYLLGKPINKLLIEKEQESQQPEYPVSTVDLENKIREDPLFEIKKREIEAKRRILENPLKMKQIEQMLSKSAKKRSSSESSDSDSSARRKKEKKKHKKSKKSHKKSKYSDSEESENERRSKRHRQRSRSRERSRERVKHGYGLKQSRKEDEKELKYSSYSKSKNHLEVQEYKNRMKKLNNIRKSEVAQSSGSRKLSDEEKQRRLKEMEQNAKWRQEVREKNVKNYKNEERKEEELEKKSKSARMQSEAALLFNSMMNEAYTSTEDRIKRNVNKIQKSTSSLE